MNKNQLGSGDERITRVFLKYNEDQLKELLENNGDINLIKKKKSNIEYYKKKLKEL